jgi:hypothetical protein
MINQYTLKMTVHLVGPSFFGPLKDFNAILDHAVSVQDVRSKVSEMSVILIKSVLR